MVPHKTVDRCLSSRSLLRLERAVPSQPGALRRDAPGFDHATGLGLLLWLRPRAALYGFAVVLCPGLTWGCPFRAKNQLGEAILWRVPRGDGGTTDPRMLSISRP